MSGALSMPLRDVELYALDVAWLTIYWKNCQNMHRKSREKSVHLRNEGNKYFQKKQYERSTDWYTKSILQAPVSASSQDPPVFAQALGNRSAALFHLKHYKECLQDINLSLACGYPVANSHKLLTRKTYCLLNLGHLEEAHQVLQTLKKLCTDESVVLATNKQDSLKQDVTSLEDKLLEQDRSPVPDDNDKEDTECCVPKLSYGASHWITQASSTIVMKHDSIKGRHLKTQKSVKAGDTLIVERPYAAVLLPDHYQSHCHHCFKILSLAPLPCTWCSVVLYCSAECRDAAWSIYHCVECCYQDLLFSENAYKSPKEDVYSIDLKPLQVGIAHLSLRIILTAGYKFLLDVLSKTSTARSPSDEVNMHYGRDYQSVYDLVTHEADMMAEDLFQYTLTAHLLLAVLTQAKWLPGTSSPDSELPEDTLGIGSLLLRHILQLVCNAHAITELQVSQVEDHHLVDTKSQVRVATAIYPTASLMNHSCDPTIISSFHGDVLVVRAVKDVAVEEEIFNCYGPHCKRMVREERQQFLSSQYFFHCTCPACEEEKGCNSATTTMLCPSCGQDLTSLCGRCPTCDSEVDTDQLTLDIGQADRDFQQGLLHLEEMNIAAATVSFHKCVDIRERTLHRHHRSLGEARDCLARCYAMTGQFASAARYLEENLPFAERTYGDSSIEVGHELQKLAEVLFNSKQVKKALDIINRALEIFQVHYGEDSKEKNMKELREMRDCLIEYEKSSVR